MPTEYSETVLRIDIDVSGDAEELDALVTELRADLLQTSVDSVERMSTGSPPPNSKSVAATSLGTLIVTLSNSAAIVALIGTLKARLGHGRTRRIKIIIGGESLSVDNVNRKQQAELIESWIKGHLPNGADDQ
jgi:hypothetical protein